MRNAIRNNDRSNNFVNKTVEEKQEPKSSMQIDIDIAKKQFIFNLLHLNFYTKRFIRFFFLCKILYIFIPVCLLITVLLYNPILTYFEGMTNQSMNADAGNIFEYILKNIAADIEQSITNKSDSGYARSLINGIGKNLHLTVDNIYQIIYVFKIVLATGLYSLVLTIYNKYFYKLVRNKLNKIYKSDVQEKIYPYNYRKKELIIGQVHNETTTDISLKPKYLALPHKGLVLNILILGSISTGKTISAIAQFLLQLIYLCYDITNEKAAMLALDVKGNFSKFVERYVKEANREDDFIVLSMEGNIRMNPLHKPRLSAMELANRIRYVLEMFSKNSHDDYFLEKAQTCVEELIKLTRLHNNFYVTFENIHNLILNEKLRDEYFKNVKTRLKKGELPSEYQYDYDTSYNYFSNEFSELSDKIRTTIVSELTRMTQPFISSEAVRNIFCPTIDEINFEGFEDAIKNGHIVLWKINAFREKKLARLVSAYLKIDYQEEVLNTLELDRGVTARERFKVLLCDEYHMYCTKNDADYVSESREANGVTIVATQSYSSLLTALHNDENYFNMLIQSLVNKIFFRTDDTSLTIKKIKEQIGKQTVQKVSQNITESSHDSKASHALQTTFGEKKNFSTGYSISEQKEELFDEAFLNRKLKEGQALCLLHDGDQLHDPVVVHLPRQHKEGRIKLVNSKAGLFRFVDFRPEAVGDIEITDDFDSPIMSELIDTESRSSKIDESLHQDYVQRNIRTNITTKAEQENSIRRNKQAAAPRLILKLEDENGEVVSNTTVKLVVSDTKGSEDEDIRPASTRKKKENSKNIEKEEAADIVISEKPEVLTKQKSIKNEKTMKQEVEAPKNNKPDKKTDNIKIEWVKSLDFGDDL